MPESVPFHQAVPHFEGHLKKGLQQEQNTKLIERTLCVCVCVCVCAHAQVVVVPDIKHEVYSYHKN